MKILIVDDDPDVRGIAAMSLKEIGGMEVAEACDGADGIAAARREHPDAILLDVTMPDMDGPTALKALRGDETTAQIPVIFLTARAPKSKNMDLSEMGVAGILTKPFSPAELPQRVRSILRIQERE
ncbi:MAG TPA: response regulator [Candidatus Brocadiia bacterium]|nr:response regulator [Candidatus Brocadiia bacterium]